MVPAFQRFLMRLCFNLLVGKSCTHAVVLARLLVGGDDHGMHPFFVQLRSLDDHTPLPGEYMYRICPNHEKRRGSVVEC